MAIRHARYGAKRRSRPVAVFSLATLAVLAAAAWIAPTVAVLTGLRDRPLEGALAGIAGSVSSGRARWAWLGPIEYHDIVLRDQAGRAVAIVPELVIDRGLVALLASPRDLGTVRLVGPEVIVDVRAGGSSLEDVIAPWLAAAPATMPDCTVEIVDGVVEFLDRPRGDAWRVADLFAAFDLDRAGALGGWTVGGRVLHAGRPDGAPAASADQPPRAADAPASRRIERATVAAGASAALARDGGFSIAAAAPAAGSARRMTVAAHRLPLGATSVAATRWNAGLVADGLAEIRLDAEGSPAGLRLAGTVETDGLALCRADTLAEVLAVEALEVPLELAVADGRVTVTKLVAVSKLFRAEASGGIRLPTAGAWNWLDGLATEDFGIAADVDLAAVAGALSGGLVVRDDVRVTDGRLEIAAGCRADGDGRVLEIRAAARDLAAVQTLVDRDSASRTERPLRWTEPFATWLKARRGPVGGLRIDEARLTSGPLEVTAAGDSSAATLQWTLDFGDLVAEIAEVVDLGGATLAGTSRGRVEVSRPLATGPSRLSLAADVEDFECVLPGRPAWHDATLAIEAEATGRLGDDGSAVMDSGRGVVTGGEDRLEATLVGGTLVDLAALGRGELVLRPAGGAAAAATDLALAGDLGRWHARLAWLLPDVLAEGVELAGRIQATASAVARGDAWEITRAAAEVERLGVTRAGWRIAEPRLVASAAGVVRPAAGRIDLASAEVLTATVSLRTAGLAWRPSLPHGGGTWHDRLRGTVQWQADVGRLERWLVTPEASGRWPASGRAWGTLQLVDGAEGLDMIVEATGSQLSLADGGGPGAPRPLWTEPQVTLAIELAVPGATADSVRLERLALESSTLVVQARGGVGGRPRSFEIDGSLACDWQQVSRLVAPWTGGALELAGSSGRPFTLRGRFAEAVDSTTATATTTATGAAPILPLPDDWLAAARAGAGGDPPAARVARPVAVSTGRPNSVDLFRLVALDTSVAWQAGDIGGFRLEAGEIPVRLVEGQLALGPFDVGVAGGRLRGAPWLSLAAEPRELVVPAARVIDRVAIGDAQARRLVAWLSPLVGHATHTTGVVSVDLAGARLPLAEPFAGLADAQVVFEALEVTPGGPLMPLATLLAKLQALVDPRLAFGDKPVLMRVRPEPVRMRLVERRLWHEGLVLDAGQLTVKSGGSVGADGSLAMAVEVALRGDVAGQAPVVSQLLRTPLVIPLKGTVERPQFDARAIDVMLARIVENTAQAVIGDGIVRGLDALLGGQQPPAAQPAAAPLVLPQGP